MRGRYLRLCVTSGALMGSLAGTTAATEKGASVHPIVCNTMLLGGSRSGRWLSSKAIARSVVGGERYRLLTLAGDVGRSTGGRASAANSASGAQIGVTLQGRKLDALGLCADWNARPHAVRLISAPRQLDTQAAKFVLRAHGMGGAAIHITQVVEADLLGNSGHDVLITATSREGIAESDEAPNRNDYSFVAAYRPGGAKVPLLLGDGYFGGSGNKRVSGPEKSSIVAVADLNGDGSMEVVVDASVYEGSGVAVFTPSRYVWKRVLSASDGV